MKISALVDRQEKLIDVRERRRLRAEQKKLQFWENLKELHVQAVKTVKAVLRKDGRIRRHLEQEFGGPSKPILMIWGHVTLSSSNSFGDTDEYEDWWRLYLDMRDGAISLKGNEKDFDFSESAWNMLTRSPYGGVSLKVIKHVAHVLKALGSAHTAVDFLYKDLPVIIREDER